MTNEPTTVSIAKALRVCFEKTCACSECPFEHESCGDIEQLAADRLESQAEENEINRHLIEMQSNVITELTARAESAERERDAAIADIHIAEEDGLCCICSFIGNDIGRTECMEECCFKWRGSEGEKEKV